MSLNQNFRRDLVGTAYELSKHTDIDNIQEKLTNPATFNKRFKKIQESVISVVEAMADIASKDKKYLQSFFQGYANPIYVKSYKYESKSSYLVSSYFASNGTPTAFNEARIFYSYYDYSNIEFNDAYVYMFKNGRLLESTEYDVYNTAYGLKGFVKSSSVNDNDEITIVINKKYNSDIKLYSKTVNTNTSSFSFLLPIIDINNIGHFYNTKYIILYIKKTSYTNYIRIPKTNYTIAMDVSGNNLNISISGITLNTGDLILVGNTTSFWQYSNNITTTTNDCCVHPTIDLKNNNLPVPFESVYDFDVFYDDLKLVPELHYSIAFSASHNVPDRLVFNFDVPSNETHKIKIFKNEPALENDFMFMYKDLLNDKGLEQFDPNFLFPVMPKLGFCYINGRFIDNQNLKTRHRSLLEVSNVTNRQDFTYLNKIVLTTELEEILNELQNSPSEMDLVVEFMGLNNVITNLYSSLPDINVIPTDSFLTEKSGVLLNNRAFYYMLISYYNYRLTQNSNLVLDANAAIGIQDFQNIGMEYATLDANECSCQTINLDCNITW